jgi:hypothetical protein
MADRIISLRFDAENKQLLGQVTDADGVVVSTWGSIKLTLGKDPGTLPADPGTNMGKEIKFRETAGCDAEGNTVYCMMLRSEFYTNPLTADPST